ncbi:acetyl-CoA carboxylase, partial [Inquilinus limosus MP06]
MTTFNLDPEFVRGLAKLLDETGLTEIEYSEGDRRIRLNRQPAPVTA